MKVLAIDLGASSGRAIIGSLDSNNHLNLEVIHRFPNGGILISDSFYWNLLNLFEEIKNGIKKFVGKYGPDLSSIGIDAWGVDYVLLGNNDDPVGRTYHYRDKRTDGILEKMFKIVTKEEIFRQTGIQFMQINTSCQLLSMIIENSSNISIIKTILMVPDYLNLLLSNKKCNEYSIATTSQLYDPVKREWAYDLIKKLGLNPSWFGEVVQPGAVLGNVIDKIAEETGLNQTTKIIAPLCHDTGSAVAAVPVDMNEYTEKEWAYLSSGTWCLLGCELKEPLINSQALEYNFTNEGGIDGTIRFLKNIIGMWLIQECKKIWDKEGLNLDWDDITKEAEGAPPFQHFISPNDPTFLNPPNMIEAIQKYCRTHDQEPPKSIGAISRTIFESLAFSYKQKLNNLEDLINKKIKILHIIGGGSQNSLLNQFTANSLKIPVKSGPIEATAIGNIVVQLIALGKIKDINEARIIIKNSFPIQEFIPEDVEKWSKAYNSYLENIK